MTPEERQALREKHGKFGFRENRTFCVFCLDDDGLDIPYPCDVIKVLDELDRVMNAAEIYGLTVKAMTEINTADVYEKRITKALDAINKINTMRVDEDDFEWLQTAEFTLKGE